MRVSQDVTMWYARARDNQYTSAAVEHQHIAKKQQLQQQRYIDDSSNYVPPKPREEGARGNRLRQGGMSHLMVGVQHKLQSP